MLFCWFGCLAFFHFNAIGNSLQLEGKGKDSVAVQESGSEDPAHVNDLKGLSVIECLELYPESRRFWS